jgi:hypothetical protein
VKVAEMRATAIEGDTDNSARTTFFLARFAGHTIGIMGGLELAALAVDVSIVGSRVAAKINTFFQNYFYTLVQLFHFRRGDGFDDAKRMNASQP